MTGSPPPIRPLAILLAAAGLTFAGCQRQEPAAPPPKPVDVAPPPAAPPSLAPPALSRADILSAVEAAAADYAAGRAAAGQLTAGRRFAIRQAFGCLGPAPAQAPDGVANWSWGKTRKTVELSLKPADWKESALAGAGDWEAVEGFWLSRPWMKDEACPSGQWAAPAEGETPQASAQTAGVAAVFEHGGSRLGRRSGRAYAFTVRGEGDQPPAAPLAGYRLLLEGRLGVFDDGQVVHCRAEGPDQRPVCIAAVVLDRVAFEDAGGAVLSEWRGG